MCNVFEFSGLFYIYEGSIFQKTCQFYIKIFLIFVRYNARDLRAA